MKIASTFDGFVFEHPVFRKKDQLKGSILRFLLHPLSKELGIRKMRDRTHAINCNSIPIKMQLPECSLRLVIKIVVLQLFYGLAIQT